jgi:hypothetical protein
LGEEVVALREAGGFAGGGAIFFDVATVIGAAKVAKDVV